MYQYGRGVVQNNNEAITWYRKAALQEYTHAKDTLHSMYSQGLGPTDPTQAKSLLNKRGLEMCAITTVCIKYKLFV